jgi:HTH-type transcriptional regulator/antitoxin HigA
MNLKPIRNEIDYEKSLSRVEILLEKDRTENENDELEIVSILLERYEEVHYKIDEPDPIEAIKFRMEQMQLKQKDLIPVFGNKARVSEVLNRKRELSVKTIRKLHKFLELPFEALFKEYNLIR